MQIFFIRGGKLIGREYFILEGTEDEADSEIIEQFITQFYTEAATIPQQVMLPQEIEEARAPLMARMDADDVMHADRLRAQVDLLDAHPEIAIAGTRVELFPEEGVRAGYREYVRWQNGCVTPEEIAANVYVESPFAHPSVMARTEVLRRLGGYAEGPFPEDYELWLRWLDAGVAIGKVPET